MTLTAQGSPGSLYELTRSPQPEPVEEDGRPSPGTIETKQYETIDNDVVRLLLDAGVVR